ncbi:MULTISPECIES: IS607 family transposase [Bacillota]|uniref:IS607 family transposase n=1 Tax=Bacillota TaxID=1239 RepID=UPI000975EEFC|nr:MULTISPECIES: IS607 family transposase [Bacillota]ONG71316.1 hypothetical protein BKK43_12175 [Bacillus cereus]MDA2667171.1 IS607 family transposase [Bacillus cereus group sp. Bc032]MDA2677875.1 IS607 family transposase [Bacillus cereus group sp. Bc031]MDA2683383.1 IS607 family transposase [Bacillus cereus group sp. Bc029]MDA2688811.1 IS607 family transposase [Bacillus cereus group sp. Bc030]
MEKFLTQKQAMDFLNVSRMTILSYEEKGLLSPVRTAGSHRRYLQSELEKLMGIDTQTSSKKNTQRAFIYARVSTKKQADAGNLERQVQRLQNYCNEQRFEIVQTYTEVASGINENRQQLHRMLKQIEKKEVQYVIVEYKDRLARFGYSYLESFCTSHGVTIIAIETKMEKSLNEEMVEDMISIITSFSARLYGQRGSRKIKNELKKMDIKQN